jgi:FixJ family two-component response regulator
MLLTVEGFPVETYASAVEFLRARSPCREGCVLTDFQMPGGLTGIELLSEIVKRGFGCPVIIMSAQGTPALREMAGNLGASDFLAKPFCSEVLLGAVRKALAIRDAG